MPNLSQQSETTVTPDADNATVASKADYFTAPIGSLGETVDGSDSSDTQTATGPDVVQTPMVQYAMTVLNTAANVAAQLRSDAAKEAVAGGEEGTMLSLLIELRLQLLFKVILSTMFTIQ